MCDRTLLGCCRVGLRLGVAFFRYLLFCGGRIGLRDCRGLSGLSYLCVGALALHEAEQDATECKQSACNRANVRDDKCNYHSHFRFTFWK